MRINTPIMVKEETASPFMKPCPFCGAKEIDINIDYTGPGYIHFCCSKCGTALCGEDFSPDDDPLPKIKELIEQWNDRPHN